MKENTKAVERGVGGGWVGADRGSWSSWKIRKYLHLYILFAVCGESHWPVFFKKCFSGLEIIRDSNEIAKIVERRPGKPPRVTPRGNNLITKEATKAGE